MATTPTLSGLELTKWRSKFITDYIRDTGFDTYMGDADTDIIHVVNDLQTDGYTIRIPLMGKLGGSGVTGNTSLTGNEQQLDQYYQDINLDYRDWETI